MFDIVTIGSITRDVFLDASFLPTKLNENFKKKKEFVLPLGDKLEIKNVYFTIGGNSANAAVTFARQGLKVACVGNIGNDVGGKEILKKLQSENIDTHLITFDKKLPTAYSVLLLKDGERTILGYHGASHNFKFPKDIKSLKARFWYLSLAGNSYKLFKKFIAFARKEKIAVAFNPSGYHIKMGKTDILKYLPFISFLVLNEEEAAMLTGISFKNEKAVFKKLDILVPGVLAVTGGSSGVTVSDGKYIYKAGVFKEKKVVDRTGAGDAFGAGFVFGLIKNGVNLNNLGKIKPEQIKEAIRIASANATSVVEHVGATEGVLKKGEFNNKRFRKLDIQVIKI